MFSPARYFQGFLNGRCLHKLSREELQSAIHHTLSSFVPKAVRATLRRVEREHPGDFARIPARYQRGARTFLEYLRYIYFPLLGEPAGSGDLDRFLEENGILGSLVRDSLRRDKRVFLVHNKDDFLLRCKRGSRCDWEELEELFQEGDSSRALIYPRGGHLGNLWFRKNQEDILRILKRGKLP